VPTSGALETQEAGIYFTPVHTMGGVHFS
jgi:hypothetical protein